MLATETRPSIYYIFVWGSVSWLIPLENKLIVKKHTTDFSRKKNYYYNLYFSFAVAATKPRDTHLIFRYLIVKTSRLTKHHCLHAQRTNLLSPFLSPPSSLSLYIILASLSYKTIIKKSVKKYIIITFTFPSIFAATTRYTFYISISI